jgi:arylsulfatase A-like enzyme
MTEQVKITQEINLKKNVIVVMLDTLSADYVGCYGNNWIKTPNLDRLAREGVLFENNYIEGVPTIPCRRTMFTGRYHVHSKGWSALDMDDTTIADLCWGRPIDTALVFDCPMYRLPKFGYTRGFDKVWFNHGHEADHDYFKDDPLYHLKADDFIDENIIKGVENRGEAKSIRAMMDELETHLRESQHWKTDEDHMVARVMKSAVNYLKQADRNKQFFLWVDSFDPHEPFDPPSVYNPDMKCPYNPDYKGKNMIYPLWGPVEGLFTEPQLHHIRMLYAEKVTMVDKWLGYLMDQVKAMGLENNTLFLMVSDHGHPFGEGKHGHGILRKCRPWPYEELVRAPMIMKGPGLPAGKRVEGFTQSCDVAPTVLDWLGLPEHAEMTGKNLLPLARGEVDTLRDFAIAGYYRYSTSIITKDWSYIHWLREDEKTIDDSRFQMYKLGIAKTSGHISKSVKVLADSFDEMQKRVKELASTLDDEDQWTCTPGSLAELPKRDMLFDRQADRYQLNNIAAKDPKKAKELFERLREFMAELRTC